MAFLTSLPPWPHRMDGGILLLVAGLFLASVLAHRYWRAKIRLEDELEVRDLDNQRVYERYRVAFRRFPAPAAFVDRGSGLVMEATPGWVEAHLPEPGEAIHGEDPAQEAAWRAIPGPGADHRPAPPLTLVLGGRTWVATCLEGPSLGVVLLLPA